MRFRYIAACLVEGLQSPADGFISLYSNEAEGKKVFLSGNTHENWNHIDTVHTIANITLKSMFQGGIFDLSQLKSYVTATTEERVRRYGPAAAFLIVEASYADETGRIGTIGQSDQREFCLALPNGFMGEVEARHRAFLEKSQALLSFVIPSVAGLQFAGKCVVADHPSGKPLYVMTFGMNARPSISKPIPTDGPELFARLFQDSVALEYFQTAFRLAAGSTSNARDNLRAFLFAFTALDSFLSRFFKKYKQRLLQHRKDSLSPAIQTYVEEIEQRRETQGPTEEDYPLAYKFAVIASYLGFNDLGMTADEFDNVARHRNAIAHGYDFDEASLPTAEARTLLGELARLHLGVSN